MTDVTAELSLFFPDGRSVPESEMAALDPASLPRFATQEGIVTIKAGDTALPIGDELSNLLSALCLDVPKALVTDGTAQFFAFANEMEIAFTRAGDTITTESEYAAPASFPADSFIKALAGVAQRFAAVYPTLWPGEPDTAKEGFAAASNEAAAAVGLG